MAETDTGTPPRVLIIVAAALATALASAVAVLGLLSDKGSGTPPTSPLALVGVPAPQAGSPQCTTLIAAAPAGLSSAGLTLNRRELAAPAPAATVAWGEADPVVLRCGLDKPPELTPTARLRVIDGVQWLQISGAGTATWYVVDRDVYAALTIPDDAGTGPLQEISTTIAAKLNARPLRF